MTWISKALSKYGESSQLAVCGKWVEAGGIEGYRYASSQGAFSALNNILNNEDLMKKCDLKPGLTDKTFIIQGLGNVGSTLAEMLVQKGAICVGVKDHDAYLYDSKGIDLQKLYEHKQKTGSIQGFGMTKPETDDSIYKEKVDILIFAAKHKSLNCYIAENVKAKVILEAADCPVTPTAHKILTGKSRIVIPDIYACSGATIASYLEYLSNLQQIRKLDQHILRQSRDIYGIAIKQSEQAMAVGSGSSISESFITKEAVADTIECVLSDVGKEMFKYTTQLKLGTDLRSSAYIVGMNKIFNNIYENKKFM
ncbi:glutamate dehydrogenase, mitochondrial-like [Diorhabda sublineata]|uniref:glutamate dehydrogenase, mitochondrial-like n=1 Tax=Diorhabda sublineata TaxID=1163346 RepID=UPI0024E11072|nr:glutamate dehydrogenase, mitochondrial-like [Diorhabda sublineata]